ncbi:hypothetical protein QQP08_017620 [Theobroma cacao]|nr:hypothetical protein QQP08_017620 [Theobroma cacao]
MRKGQYHHCIQLESPKLNGLSILIFLISKPAGTAHSQLLRSRGVERWLGLFGVFMACQLPLPMEIVLSHSFVHFKEGSMEGNVWSYEDILKMHNNRVNSQTR